jgi:glutathione synthase/RimK-type ligase-like ATP-grasp enzyme
MSRSVDPLLPSHEQVAVLSARRSELGVATVVPEFESLPRVQDKLWAHRTLAETGLPLPAR